MQLITSGDITLEVTLPITSGDVLQTKYHLR